MSNQKHLIVIDETGSPGSEQVSKWVELSRDESKKIKHAEEFFKQMNKEGSLDVKFETQFNDVEIADIINKYVVE